MQVHVRVSTILMQLYNRISGLWSIIFTAHIQNSISQCCNLINTPFALKGDMYPVADQCQWWSCFNKTRWSLPEAL